MPAFIEPQLATLVADAPAGDDWLHELKYDGYRIMARLENGRATLTSRRGNDWTAKFPSVRAAVEKLPARTALLDGEVAVTTPDGRTSFQALQNALSGQPAALVYFAFDLLHRDGRDLTPLPLEQRKGELAELIAGAPAGLPVRYSDHVVGRGAAFFAQAQARGLEGIVSKRRTDPHRPGRSPGWLKIKAISRQELVIGGFTEPEGSRAALGALLMGYYDAAGVLTFAGKVGTGFTHKLLVDMRKRLGPLEQADSPFVPTPPRAMTGPNVHWVRPELVGEVAFSEWTGDGRLRHPSFQGLREDKKPREVVRERPKATAAAAAEEDAPVEPKRVAKATTKPAKKTTAKAAAKPAASKSAGNVVSGEAISNPGRVVYPKVGISKLDVARYYEAAGEVMLPHVQGRPLSIVRCPQGLAAPCFYMKHHKLNASPALGQIPIREKTKTSTYLVVQNPQGLVALAQLGVLEVHTWNSTADSLEHPDRFVLDLDPGPEVKWADTVATALLLRDRLKALGLESYVKTTGGKGLHVVVPLAPVLDWDRNLALSRAIAGLLEREQPKRYTLSIPKAGRENKILIDYLRNNRGSTAVAAYSTRAKPEATVSVPLAWDELDAKLRSEDFTIPTVIERLRKQRKDPWAGFFDNRQKLKPELQRLLES
jgi:bifunctional non-homologous end joining protein LigD